MNHSRQTVIGWLPRLQHAGLLSLAYVACAMPLLYLTKQPGGLASIWIANAVACAFLIELPRKHWPLALTSIGLSVLAASLLFGDPLSLALYFCAANLLESSLAAWLLQRCKHLAQFNESPQALLKVLARACFLPVAISASIGALGLYQIGLGSYPELWLLWFAGSCTGMTAMLPLALIWRQGGTRALLQHLDPLLTPAILLLYLAIGILALLYVPMSFVYLSVPLILIALYCNPATVALMNLAAALLFIAMLSLGFFIPPPVTASWQALFIFPPILGALLPSLLLASSLQQSRNRELRIKLSEQRFHDTLEFSGTGLMMINQHGIISEVNLQLCRMTGFSRDELLGSNALRLLAPEAQPLAEEKLHGLRSRAQSSYSVDRQIQHKDGSFLWISMNLSTLPNSDGPDEVIVQITDIDAHIKTQQHLERLRGEAEQSNLAKSAFLANMSHEIRTPMNAVLGIAQLLEHTALDTSQRQYLSMLNDSGKLLLSVINDILDFSKIESGSLRLDPIDFPLEQLVRHLASLMTVIAGEQDLQLSIHIDPEVPDTLHADLYRLEQVLINLAGNAVKFTEQGFVSVHISRPASDQLHFSIRDSGIGLTEAQQAELFQPFIQTDTSLARKRAGTGLGLAISKRLVTLMDGRIGVNSQLGKGSEFWFSLPMQADAPTAAPMPAPSTARRVLLISNSPQSCANLSAMSAALGTQLDTVTDSDSALQRIAQQPPYQLLLLDCSRSDLNGQHSLQALQQLPAGALPPLRVLVNGYTQAQLLATHADGISAQLLTTPLTLPTLAQCLHNKPTAAQPNAIGQASAALQGVHVLLVEDNAINQLMAQKALELHGAQVSIAADGHIAIDALRHQAERFDAVLMDIQMPGMDGYTATRIIRHELQLNLPILAMSAGVTSAEKTECNAAGMNDFIAKPMNVQNLISTLCKHLGSRSAVPVDDSITTSEMYPQYSVFAAAPLNQLCAHSTATRSAIRALVRGFVDQGNAPIEEIRAALLQQQYAAAASIVHTLRGSLGTLGAEQLSHLSHALEGALNDASVTDVQPLLARFEQALQRLQLAFNHWLEEHSDNISDNEPADHS